jgi:hypothetical protein
MSAATWLRRPALAGVLALGACASVPTGPTVPVLPGAGKSFDQFHADDGMCQQFAMTEATGTRPGAAAAAGASTYAMQRKYDLSYIQCMYAKGHRVPVLGPMAVRPAQFPGQLPPPPGPAAPPPTSTPR